MSKSGKRRRWSDEETASLQIQNLKNGVELFYIDTGRYPTEEEGLAALFQRPEDGSSAAARWDGPYLESEAALTDPWDRPYLYDLSEEGREFRIRSLGRDGLEGGEGEASDIVR